MHGLEAQRDDRSVLDCPLPGGGHHFYLPCLAAKFFNAGVTSNQNGVSNG